jgi:hypothetical protein
MWLALGETIIEYLFENPGHGQTQAYCNAGAE